MPPPGTVTSRSRVLSDPEMAAIYRAAVKLAFPYGDIVLVAIHTAMRRSEVGGLRWDFITTETISLPPALTKNRREHVLPNLIAENLALIPRTSEYLFPAPSGGPFNSWGSLKAKLDGVCHVQDFVLHDFRRYFSTTMAKLRVPIDVTEAILNHVSGSRSAIQRVYDRYDRLTEMRKALELYEKHLANILR